MNAIEILEQIQKQYYFEANISTTVKSDVNSDDYWNFICDLLADNPNKENIILGMRSAKKYANPVVLLTKYENYSLYSTLVKLFEKIGKVKDDVLEFHKIIPPTESSIYFGTFEGDFNAFAISCSGNDRLIMLSSKIFSYAYRLSSILSLFFPLKEKVNELHGDFSYNTDDIKNCIKNSPEIITLFCDLILVCKYNENPIKFINVRSSTPHLSMLAAQFYDSFLSFVVSHEYSHFLLNHFEDDYIKNLVSCDDTDYKKDYEKYHNQEYKADILAFRLTIAALQYNGSDYIKNMIGIISCMKLLGYIGRLNNVRDDIKSYHPSSRNRLDNLFEEWDDKTFNCEKTLFIEISNVFDVMWDKFNLYYNIADNHYKETNKDILNQKFEDIQKFIFDLSRPR